MRFCYIYKITNKINNKIYIGQTSSTIKRRWQQHINDSKSRKNDTSLLHKAINKYGKENFSIEQIDYCLINLADDKEIYWIKYYDSYKKGYNKTLGGDGCKRLDINEEKIITYYIQCKNIHQTSTCFNISAVSIKEILLKNHCDIYSNSEVLRNLKSIDIQAIDKNNNNKYYFKSYREAAEWCIKNNLSNQKINIIASTIRSAVIYAFIYCNIKWYSTSYSKEYIQRNKNNKIISNRKYNKIRYQKNKNICPKCGIIKSKESILCRNCYYKKQKMLSNKPPIEILKQLINNNMTYKAIGQKYQVSDKTAKKWCVSYNLIN